MTRVSYYSRSELNLFFDANLDANT